MAQDFEWLPNPSTPGQVVVLQGENLCTSKPTDGTRSSLGVMECGATLRISVFTCGRVYDLMSLWHSSGDRTQEGDRETREKGGQLAGCGDNRHKDGQEPVGGQGQRSPKENTAAGRPG